MALTASMGTCTTPTNLSTNFSSPDLRILRASHLTLLPQTIGLPDLVEEKDLKKSPKANLKSVYKVSVIVNKCNARKNAAITMCVSLAGTVPKTTRCAFVKSIFARFN